MTGFLRRLGECVLPVLRAIDILACALWLSALYPFGLADRPTGREMISSYVGEAAYNGHRWARIAARVIDWLFLRLAGERDHCHANFLRYRLLDD